MNKGTNLKGKVTAIVAGVLIFLATTGFIMWLLQRVSEGKGTDLYLSQWGISFSAIGVLIIIPVAIVASIIGVFINRKYAKEEQDFLKKYGKK